MPVRPLSLFERMVEAGYSCFKRDFMLFYLGDNEKQIEFTVKRISFLKIFRGIVLKILLNDETRE